MNRFSRNLALLLLIFLVFAVLFQLVTTEYKGPQPISYTKFLELVKDGKVVKVEIKGRQFNGLYRETQAGEPTPFETSGFESQELYDKLYTSGVEVTVVPDVPNPFWNFLVTWLPMILIIGIFIFFMRQLQGSGGKAMSFGKSRARLITGKQNKITFKDVAGVDESKEELSEIIEFLKDPKRFTKIGGRIPKGVLLMGAPGTGKTLLAKAIAGEAGVPFFSISGSDFVEMFVGVGASRVRDLFVQGKKNAPCIIFIDEIDAVGRHRGAGLGGGHDEREQTLNQLLVEMDGFESNEGVILIAATNRPDVLDPALLRPGRFDRRVVVPPPDIVGRELILKVHTRKVPLSKDVKLDVISRGTPGFTGADLSNLVNEAALNAARRGKTRVYMQDFEESKDKVLMGRERRSLILSEEEKKNTAYHEAGHALVGAVLANVDPVHKVTIIPRGVSLGLTQTLPVDDRHNYTREYLLDLLAFMMGGRVAEEIALDHMTTGASNDIQRATETARRMVMEWGMSDKLGPLSYGRKEEMVFLGKELAHHQDYSETTAHEIDTEVRRLVGEAYEHARKILTDRHSVLDAISNALLEYETIDGDELAALVRGETIEREAPADDEEEAAPAAGEEVSSGNGEAEEGEDYKPIWEREDGRASADAPHIDDSRDEGESGSEPDKEAPLSLVWRVRGRVFDLAAAPLVVGIVNVTPDSFSDGGVYLEPNQAVRRGVELHEAGAGLIDVGGFSSRPGAVPVSADEQIGRIVPVVRALSQEHGIPTSIDANDAAVAEAALGAGACALNDISGLQADPSIADLAAREGAGLVLMHMRGTPETMASMTDYGDVVGDVREALERSYRQALDAGVQHENIVIDPGIGFAKTAAQSTVILARLEEFAAIGRPVFIGVSRKSFLGAVTGRAAAARLGETVAATLFAFDHGARIHRVHDAGEAAAALAVWQTLRGAEKRADS